MESGLSDIEENLFLEKVAEFERKDVEIRETLKQLQIDAEATYKKIYELGEADKREVLKKTRSRIYPRVEEIGELMDEFIRMHDEQVEKTKEQEPYKF